MLTVDRGACQRGAGQASRPSAGRVRCRSPERAAVACWPRTSPPISTCRRSTRRSSMAMRSGRATCRARTARLRSARRSWPARRPTRPLAPGEAAVDHDRCPGAARAATRSSCTSGRESDGGRRVDRRARGPRRAEYPAARPRDAGRRGRGHRRHGPASRPTSACWPRSAGRRSRVVRPRVAVVSDRRRAGRARPGARAGPDPQLERGHARGPWRSSRGRGRRSLPIARRRARLRCAGSSRAGSTADVLLVTGGVSAGQRDLVPAALAELGVRRVFHKVRLKPGKPLWFGVGPDARTGTVRTSRHRPLVFGLPGNPVSGLVGFLLFVRPALAVLAGRPRPDAPRTLRGAGWHARSGTAATARPTSRRGWPRVLTRTGGLRRSRSRPSTWSGSADLLDRRRGRRLRRLRRRRSRLCAGRNRRFPPLALQR